MSEQFNLDGNIKIKATDAINALRDVGKLLDDLAKKLTEVESKFKSSPLIKNIDSKINKASMAAQKLKTEELKTETQNQKLYSQKLRNKAIEAKAEQAISKAKFQQLKVDEKSQKIVARAKVQNFDQGRADSLKNTYTSFLQTNRKLSESDAKKVAGNTFSNIKTNSGLNSIESRMILAIRRQQLSEEQKISNEQRKQARILEQQKNAHGSILDKIFNIKNALMSIVASDLARMVGDLIEVANRLQAIDIKFKALASSSREAKEQSSWIWKRAKELRVPVMEAAEGYSQFYAAAKDSLSTEEIKGVYDALLQTSVVLHLNKDRFKLASLAFEQMISKGTVSMEELRRQLGEHIPGAFVIAAKAMGTSQKELNDLIKGGKLASNEFLIKFAPALIKAFGDGVPDALNSSQSKIQALQNEGLELQKIFIEAGFAEMIGDMADSLRVLLSNQDLRNLVGHISSILEKSYKLDVALRKMFGNVFFNLGTTLQSLNRIMNFLDRIMIWLDQVRKYGWGAVDSAFTRIGTNLSKGKTGIPLSDINPLLGLPSSFRSLGDKLAVSIINNISANGDPKSIQKAVEKGNAPITNGQAFQNAKLGLSY